MDAAGTGMNLEKLVKEQLKDSFKNADVLTMLQRIVDAAPVNEETDAIRKKLQEIMERYNTMNDDEKSYFATFLKNAFTNKLADKLDEMPMDLTELQDAIQGAVMSQLYLLAAGAVIVFILLVFFGYKLYKSIKEKEKKRQEKKKLKEMKKKK